MKTRNFSGFKHLKITMIDYLSSYEKEEIEKGAKIKGSCCDKLLGIDLMNSISLLNYVPDHIDE